MLLFGHRLCLALGRPDVEETLSGLSASQFQNWLTYALVEPFGPAREDWRAGMLAATIVNNMPLLKRRKTYQPMDFIPKLRLGQAEQTWQQMKSTMRMYMTAIKNMGKRGG